MIIHRDSMSCTELFYKTPAKTQIHFYEKKKKEEKARHRSLLLSAAFNLVSAENEEHRNSISFLLTTYCINN